jgi:hypothetical protein
MSSSKITEQLDTRTAARARTEWVWPLVLVALGATTVIAPIWFFGDASGHDFQFHIASWVEMARQWHQGILFPRWAEWANWGYGEPRFIFYPPASRIIGGALGLVLPWRAVASAYIWLALVGSGMAMWTLAHEWLSRDEAAAAACFFALNPYNLALVYYRSDFAELLTVALLPLLILAVLRSARDGWTQVPFFAVIFAAIWMSDAPGAVIATYSAVLLLFVSCALERNRRPILSGGVGMLCGFGLAAFYILPAAWEQRWVNLAFAVQGNYRIAQNFLFSHTGDPEFQLFNSTISTIALAMILACGAFAVFMARRRHVRELWWLLIALGGASTFMMCWPSDFLWRLLPKLRFVQFPWRWLDMLAPAFALFTAAGVAGRRKRWIVWASVVLLLGMAGTEMARNAWWDSDSAIEIAQWVRWGVGYEGTNEFAPLNCDRYGLYGVNPALEQPPVNTIPLATEFDPASGAVVPATSVRAHVESWTAERRILAEESARPVTLELRLLAYPAWQVRIDGHTVATGTTSTGAIWVRVPAGRHQIDLQFRRTWDRIAGGAISLFSVILICAWAAGRHFFPGAS